MDSGRQIKVGLVQIGDKFGEQYYFPYSIGLLQAYAQKNLRNPEEFTFQLPVYKKSRINKAVEYLGNADIIFFSAYIWNFRISLEIASSLKKHKKDCIIVFGGPQIPESIEGIKAFLTKRPFIDIGSYGEGEMPFLKILENIKNKRWENVPSIGFRAKDGTFRYNPATGRIKNLNEIPSVYLEGIFDHLIRQENWSALIETNRGCPYTCAFCYWGKRQENRIYQYDLERVFKEIDWLSEHKIQFIFCCDGNFGILPRDIDIARKVAENKKKYGYPEAFSVQNTKNSTKKIFMMQKTLADSGLQKGVNIALQSLNEDTLLSINRNNISNAEYSDLQRMFSQNKIPTFSDMIIGLPKETYATFTDGVSRVIDNGQHNKIQFINLSVLENTLMSELDYQNKYGLIIKESTLIPHHTGLDADSEIEEMQNLVIGTDSMPRQDWLKTRIFSWMISLLYFNKLLQVPFLLINRMCSLSFRELTEVFTLNPLPDGKISGILEFFTEKAESIQEGDCEYVASKEWLNIWWPADEYAFIRLCAQDSLAGFYEEAELIIGNFLKEKKMELPSGLLHDALSLNYNLIKLPFIERDLTVSLKYNVFDVYQGILSGFNLPLSFGDFNYVIDRTSCGWKSWDGWLKEVVWYGSKKGAYLFGCKEQKNYKGLNDLVNRGSIGNNYLQAG